jgi:hypothetical protein
MQADSIYTGYAALGLARCSYGGHILCNHLSWCKRAIKRSGASDLDLMITVILYLTPST